MVWQDEPIYTENTWIQIQIGLDQALKSIFKNFLRSFEGLNVLQILHVYSQDKHFDESNLNNPR